MLKKEKALSFNIFSVNKGLQKYKNSQKANHKIYSIGLADTSTKSASVIKIKGKYLMISQKLEVCRRILSKVVREENEALNSQFSYKNLVTFPTKLLIGEIKKINTKK